MAWDSKASGPGGVRNPVILNGRVYLVSENRLYIYGLI